MGDFRSFIVKAIYFIESIRKGYLKPFVSSPLVEYIISWIVSGASVKTNF